MSGWTWTVTTPTGVHTATTLAELNALVERLTTEFPNDELKVDAVRATA